MASHQSLFVGITCDEQEAQKIFRSPFSISNAVYKAGGIPLLLPSVFKNRSLKNLVSKLSGVIIAGGAFDIPPSFYREEKRHRLDAPQIQRTHFEFRLIRETIRQKKPLLGICGGMQAINVALGGTLYQDIHSEIPNAYSHEQKVEKSKPTHFVKVVKKSKLHAIFRVLRMRVNSTHHQAVKDPGKKLMISAFSEDGVIEAIESEKESFVLGVQWHPEALKGIQNYKIFKEFMRRCNINHSQ